MIIGNPIFNRVPERFKWTVHNIWGHRYSEILYLLGFEKLSNKVHDWTIPMHDTEQEGRG